MDRYFLTTLVSMAMSACLLSSLMFLNFGENISTVIRFVAFTNRLLGQRELYFAGSTTARRSWVHSPQTREPGRSQV